MFVGGFWVTWSVSPVLVLVVLLMIGCSLSACTTPPRGSKSPISSMLSNIMERIDEYRFSTDASDNVPDVANMARALQSMLSHFQQLKEQLHDKR